MYVDVCACTSTFMQAQRCDVVDLSNHAHAGWSASACVPDVDVCAEADGLIAHMIHATHERTHASSSSSSSLHDALTQTRAHLFNTSPFIESYSPVPPSPCSHISTHSLQVRVRLGGGQARQLPRADCRGDQQGRAARPRYVCLVCVCVYVDSRRCENEDSKVRNEDQKTYTRNEDTQTSSSITRTQPT